MLSSHVFSTKSRPLPESSAIAGSSGGDAEAGAELPELLKLERGVDDPGELAAEATVDEGRLATDVRAVALGTAGRRSGEESLRGPLQGVLGPQPDHIGRGRDLLLLPPLRLRQLHGRRPLYSSGTPAPASRKGFANGRGPEGYLGPMRVGVVLDGRRTAAEIAELARLAETHGFSHVWLSGGARTKDHFVRLALAAAATRRIRLGRVALSPFEMHPVSMGLALLTLDEIAPGRASLVLGAGGDLAATLGLPAKGRVAAVEECIDIVRALASGGEINYAGAHYRVTGLFSPWSRVRMDRLYLGANRPRQPRRAARKADGVMVTDMPLGYLGALLGRVRAGLAAARREATPFALSNWFVWNVQDTLAEAERLARRQLGFRLYYIRDVASSLGLSEPEARELQARQPEMIRAIFAGRGAWSPAPPVADLLIKHLTLTSDRRGLEHCLERLVEVERGGRSEIALAPHRDPAAPVKLVGTAGI